MNKLIKNVLNTIEKKGFEAYVVGGYVRDLLLGRLSYDVDICTNATPKELIAIFPQAGTKNLGGIYFKVKEYNFEIMTYREEIKYENRRPVKYNYINNLLQDLKRRDFTINAICMNLNGDIIDLLKGTQDLSKRSIRMIGDAKIKIKEDPLRILRGVRFATVLDFGIEPSLYDCFLKYKDEVKKLSTTRIKEELDKILISLNPIKGLKLLDNLGILKLLGISYKDIVPVKNIDGMYAQIEVNIKLPFTKTERENIKSIKEIIKNGEINNMILYKKGLYICLVAGEILNISKKEINKMYKSLSIHEKKDIDISFQDIGDILNINNSKRIGLIIKEIEKLILKNKIRNKKSEIIKYLKENKDRWMA